MTLLEAINVQLRRENPQDRFTWTCGLKTKAGYCQHETYQGSRFHSDLLNEGLDARDPRSLLTRLPLLDPQPVR